MHKDPPALTAEPSVGRLAELAREAGTRPVPDAWRERTLAAIARKRHVSRAPYALAFAAAGLIALGVVLGLRIRSEAPLAYSVDGAPSLGSYVSAGPRGAVARFNEGTQIDFTAGTRGRIVAVTARGAQVTLDEGGAHVRVVHREHAEWLVEAGPFTVAVTGTEFDVAWYRERLLVTMQSGTVIVRGPRFAEGLALHDHQQLSADVAHGKVSISDAPLASATTPTPVDASAAAAPALAEDPAPRAAPLAAFASASAAAREALVLPLPVAPSFRERVARGEFASVIADAEAQGLDAVISKSSLADLAALADAARYAGRGDLARRALLAERSRFDGSAEARSAAFLLGRMTEQSSPAAAVGWYDTYLAESPAGSLAPEALGRKLVAMKSSADRRATRVVAEQYLRRYPGGAFASAATDVLRDD